MVPLSGAKSEDGENRLLETISKHNVAKLRRELIYIYKLPPVTDQDYENEELRLGFHKHGTALGGVWFFDDLDTDDYLTDDKSIKSQTPAPHRFSSYLSSSSVNSVSNVNSNGQIKSSHNTRNNYHSRFGITHPSVNPTPGNGKETQQPLPKNVYASQFTVTQKSGERDDSDDSGGSVSHKNGRADTSGLPEPLPQQPTTKTASYTANIYRQGFIPSPTLPMVQNSKPNETQTEKERESMKRVKFYNTGHFRKNTAIIWDPHPQYIFHAFAHRFHLMLNLIPEKHSFLTPNFAVTTHTAGKEFANETFVWRENLKGKISGCFYNGFVLGDPQSSVAVSLCHGMVCMMIFNFSDLQFHSPER